MTKEATVQYGGLLRGDCPVLLIEGLELCFAERADNDLSCQVVGIEISHVYYR